MHTNKKIRQSIDMSLYKPMEIFAIRTTNQPHTSRSSISKRLISSSSPTTTLPFNKSQHSWNRLTHDSLQLNSQKIGHNWMQYHGLNNWEGLLDPLDDNLRSEILRYGQFVEAAYRSFDFDTTSPTYATCRYSKRSLLPKSGVKKTGYKITKNLHATCGVQVPKWIENMYHLPRVKSSWIGYVAVCQDKKEIKRLGRRDVVIALRGTATCLEWLENLRATLRTWGGGNSENNGCMVENGFLSLYVSKTETTPSLQEMIREEVGRVIQMYGNEPLSLTITGHSLGAALAILSAYDITITLNNVAALPLVTVISFGGPRVGNEKFRSELEESGTRILRIVNSDDVFTKVPGFIVRRSSDDMEENEGVHVGGFQSWFRRRVEEMRLVYADVGQELRLSSKELPYVKKGDVATCHDLKTYLHLVDCFVSSSCPYVRQPIASWTSIFKHASQNSSSRLSIFSLIACLLVDGGIYILSFFFGLKL